jgi:hypothetical protein
VDFSEQNGFYKMALSEAEKDLVKMALSKFEH